MKSILQKRARPAGLFIGILLSAAGYGQGPGPLYLDPAQPVEARVEDLLKRLTLEEKVSLVHANSKFNSGGIPRLGIPELRMSDGPHGVREEIERETWRPAGRTDDFASYLPVGMALAATWNTDVARIFGETLGREALARGKDVMLGPGLNIMRTPLCGRNFEYFGEDPYLTGRMGVSAVRGMQSQEVAACVKHFAANNQEWQRGSINVEMDERTLREIYLPAFKAAVEEAGVLTVMGAYNRFRGAYCCHNDFLLNTVLKREWGFKGLVMSDWNGTHDTREPVFGGLDLEMGTNKPVQEFFLAGPFLDGLKKGEFPDSILDDKVRRNLRVLFTLKAFDGKKTGSMNTAENQNAARRTAEEGMVLLKNEGHLLPLKTEEIRTLAVIGGNAIRKFARGGGSSGIKAFYEITPLEGIVQRVGAKVNVVYSEGYTPAGQGFPRINPAGMPPGTGAGIDPPRPLPLGIGPEGAPMPPPPWPVPQEKMEPRDSSLAERAVQAAEKADAVIVIAGLNHGRFLDAEGVDRRDMKLPYGQDELISRVAKANPRTAVVVMSGAPVEMDAWLDRVPAVLQAWYAGMEGGNALARILFGDVNPSGKLPCTFPARLEDSPAHALGAYPGKDGTVRYDEGLLVGYRWFDAKSIEPLFPFGHGLSYTAFAYSKLRFVRGSGNSGPLVEIRFEMENTGKYEGGETAQVYVQDMRSSLPRPVKELKGFQKVFLKPGEKTAVSIPLDRTAFSFFDPGKGGWLAEKGDFRILVGSSSRDIRLQGKFKLQETLFENEGRKTIKAK